MNYFDDEAPLSKIGVAALFLIFFGLVIGLGSLLWGIDDFKTPRVIIDIFLLAAGCLMMWGGYKIACSKIAYRDDREAE